ncbi:hypothetical protein BHE74_00009648 [Ensete ventricosum]|nr:hypothetical protein BHE74_00009648 [Ensete ventricosum]
MRWNAEATLLFPRAAAGAHGVRRRLGGAPRAARDEGGGSLNLSGGCDEESQLEMHIPLQLCAQVANIACEEKTASRHEGQGCAKSTDNEHLSPAREKGVGGGSSSQSLPKGKNLTASQVSYRDHCSGGISSKPIVLIFSICKATLHPLSVTSSVPRHPTLQRDEREGEREEVNVTKGKATATYTQRMSGEVDRSRTVEDLFFPESFSLLYCSSDATAGCTGSSSVSSLLPTTLYQPMACGCELCAVLVSHPMFATFSGTPRRFPYAADAASGICSTCCPHAINYRKHFMRNPHRT